MRMAIACVALLAGCGGITTGLEAALPVHLDDAPIVLVRVQSGGGIDWQKERDEDILPRLEECLPAAVAPLCPGSCEVKESDGELQPHVVLTATTAYEASAHFMHGFRLVVVYEIWDRTGTTRLARYVYKNEPLSKVMAEEGTDMDAVLTYYSVKTADAFCDDVGMDAADLASKGG
jgi:hypothetical protein